MFTGIVSQIGKIESINHPNDWEISVSIKNKTDLGLPIDMSVNKEFEKKSKAKNIIFSNGIDFLHEFFNLESKTNTNLLSKSVKLLGKNPSINKMFTKIADQGIIF